MATPLTGRQLRLAILRGSAGPKTSTQQVQLPVLPPKTTHAPPPPKQQVSAGDLLNDFFSPEPVVLVPKVDKENHATKRKLDEELQQAESAKITTAATPSHASTHASNPVATSTKEAVAAAVPVPQTVTVPVASEPVQDVRDALAAMEADPEPEESEPAVAAAVPEPVAEPTAVEMAPPIKPPRHKRSASSLKSLEADEAPLESQEAEDALVQKRPKVDEFRARACTVGVRPQTVLRPMSTWFKDARKRPMEEDMERHTKIIDGIEKMIKVVSEDDEERLVQLNFELVTARASVAAMQEARLPAASSARTRLLSIEKISLPVHWWATISHRERSNFHFFLLFQLDHQVRYTSMVSICGADSIDELVFDEAINFGAIPFGASLSIKLLACKTVKKETTSFSSTPKKKAMELAHSMAQKLHNTPRKLLERLTHHEKRHDAEVLLSETPRKRAAIEFTQIASVVLSSAVLIAMPKFVELHTDAAEAFPVGNTLCFSPILTHNDSDTVKFSGYLTFFEQAGVSGSWVRRQATLDGSVLRCLTTNDNGRNEAVQATFDLAKHVGATVRKIPRSECARLNSFAIQAPGKNEPETVVRMAADTKESREEWLQHISQSLADIAAWAGSASA